MENQVTITKSEELQLMEAKAAAEFAVTSAGQMLRVFETTQRIGKMLSTSSIVPKDYQNNVSNCAIAVDMAMHLGTGISPLTVMQNLVIVQGRPTWSAAFLISCVNTCGRFSPLRYEEKNLGKIGKIKVNKYMYENGKNTQKLVETDEYADVDNLSCTAIAIDKETGEELTGTTITIKMALEEGWYAKNGSKWVSMPQQMLRYRAASFWQRAYAPEIGMGFHTTEEMRDAAPVEASFTEIKEEKKSIAELAMEEAMKPKEEKAPVSPEKEDGGTITPKNEENAAESAKSPENANKQERTLL